MEKVANFVTELEITEAVRKIVRNSDLSQITVRVVRNDIIENFGERLGPMQDRIKTVVRAALDVVLNEKSPREGPGDVSIREEVIDPTSAQNIIVQRENEKCEPTEMKMNHLNQESITSGVKIEEQPTAEISTKKRDGIDVPGKEVIPDKKVTLNGEKLEEVVFKTDPVDSAKEGSMMKESTDNSDKRRRRRRMSIIDEEESDDEDENDKDADFEPGVEMEDAVKPTQQTVNAKKRRGRPPGNKKALKQKVLIDEEILDGDKTDKLGQLDEASVGDDDDDEPIAKRRRKRTSSSTESSEEKHLKKYLSIARSIGYRVPPIRFRGKSTIAEKREAVINYLREKGFNILDKANTTPQGIERFRRKADQEKELAGLDTRFVLNFALFLDLFHD